LMNFLSTHDTVRAITKLAGPEADDHDRSWQAEHSSLTHEQYQIGKERLKIAYAILFMLPGIPSIYYGDEIGMQGMKDPFNRQCMDWDGGDKELLAYFEKLCGFRYTESSFLSEAGFKFVTCEDRYLVIDRFLNGKTLRLVVNTGKHDKDISYLFDGMTDDEVRQSKRFASNADTLRNLRPRSCLIYELNG